MRPGPQNPAPAEPPAAEDREPVGRPLLTPARAFAAAAVLTAASLTMLLGGLHRPAAPTAPAAATATSARGAPAAPAVSTSPSAGPAPRRTAAATMSPTLPATRRPAPAPTSASASAAGTPPDPSGAGDPPAAVPDPLAGPVSDRYLQRVLTRTSPADLPAGQEQALVALGRRVLLADLSGAGRDQFPGYFDGPATTSWTRVHVHAGIARTVAGRDDQIDVTLIWSATDPTGRPAVRQRSVVRLGYDSRGGWGPRHRS